MLYGPTKVNILRAFCFLMWKIVYGLKCKHVSAWSWAWSWWPGVMLLLSQPGHWTRPPCGHFDLNIQRRINGSGEMILGLVLTPRVAQLAGGLEWPLIWDKLLALKTRDSPRHADYAVFVSSLPWCLMSHDTWYIVLCQTRHSGQPELLNFIIPDILSWWSVTSVETL